MPESGAALSGGILDTPLDLGDGRTVTLRSFAQRWLVLYFYPKDSTPGCSAQGRDFQALLPQFQALGAHVIGVSRDSVKSHASFSARQGYTFPLVSDVDEVLCRAFGVIQPRKLYGREFEGIVRSTFLINGEGCIVGRWMPVKVPGHAQAVLDALRESQPRA